MSRATVISNLAVSLDGKIATTSREFFPLGTAADRKLMQDLRKQADIVLMGASTLRTFKGFCGVTKWNQAPFKQPANGIFSQKLAGIDPKWSFFKNPKLKRVFFVSPGCPQRRRALFERTCQIVEVPPLSVAQGAVSWLKTQNYKKILVEGGGTLMWEFVKLHLIDEFYVTLTPWILGGTGAPSLVDGLGFSPKTAQRLKLIQSRRVGNEVYLRYKRLI